MPRFLFRCVLLALLGLLLVPALALAAGGLGFAPSIQTWALILGAITPLVTYGLNHIGPQVSEATKAIVLAVVAGVVGAVYTAIQSSTFGWNDSTIQLVLTAIVGAFGAHALIWKPSGINAKLGGGSNAPKAPARGSSV